MKPVITLVGPERVPVTDGMIIRGTRNLLAAACPEALVHYIAFSEAEHQQQVVPEDTTHLIVTGTPWIWHTCWKSQKYNSMQEIRRMAPDARVLFFGIGACYTLGVENEVMQDCIDNKKKLQNFFQDDLIVTRDPLAQATLAGCIIPSRLLTCPAFYASEDYTRKVDASGAALFFYDPTYPIGISRGVWDLNDRYDFIMKQLNFAKETDATTYCVDTQEMQVAESFGLRPQLLTTTDEAFDAIQKASEIMSGRIHLAIPALSLRKKITLLPVDSRAETYYHAIKADNQADRDNLIMELQDFIYAK